MESFGRRICKFPEKCRILQLIMESTRQAKIARLLQKELSELFRKQTAALGGVLVSVCSVRVSPDLSVARAYLSVFPSKMGEDIVKNTNANAKTIRFELAKILRYQLRKMPELSFYIDDSLDYIEHIDNLLKQDSARRGDGAEEN